MDKRCHRATVCVLCVRERPVRTRKSRTYLSAGVDLADEKVDANICNTIEERLALLRILEQPRFSFLEGFGPTSLDHVREEGPRCATEANKWDLAAEPVSRPRNSLKDVAKFLLHVDVLAQAANVRWRVERSRECGGGVHKDLHAHGLRDDENVAKNDGCVDETRVPPYWLQCNLARQRRRLTYLKKLVLCTKGTEFCRDRRASVSVH
jgi:hypothetical protein